MTPPRPQSEALDRLEALLVAARGGSREALGQLLELGRPYLLHLANAALDAPLQAKAGASDLVQETFLEAQRIFARFQGGEAAELLAWLRAILLNKVDTFTRQFYGTGKRQIGKEVALDAGSTPGGGLAGQTPTPSHQMAQAEQTLALTCALEQLPEHYRQVIVWRQWEALPFEEIARRLNRSVDATRMLWWRALERLQQQLEGL
jgi:RNA polymerase sigma-70 factor (ECF subfamily)